MSQFKNQKFRVPNQAVARALQEKLFAEGYRFAVVSQDIKVGFLFFYTYDTGKITTGTTEDFFDHHDNKEMTVVTESRLVVAELKPKREKVVLFGKTYYKDELDAALAQLEVVKP